MKKEDYINDLRKQLANEEVSNNGVMRQMALEYNISGLSNNVISPNTTVINEPHVNGLSNAALERLAVLVEECGESLQCIGKILRHGYDSTHPNGGPTNRDMLERELADVTVAAELLYTKDENGNSDLSADRVYLNVAEKLERVGEFLKYNADLLDSIPDL